MKEALFGNDEIDFNGKLIKKARDISFFREESNFEELETIRINDIPAIGILEKINELVLSKPSILISIYLKDIHGFSFDKLSDAVNMTIMFQTLTAEVDIGKFEKIKRLNISSLDGSGKKYIQSLENLTQLEDLRIGGFKSDLEFINGLTQLKRLDCKSVKSAKGLEFLKNKQQLKYLIIYQGKFSNYKGIDNCINLLRLDLGYLRKLNNEIMTDSLSALKKLKAVELTALPELSNINFLSGCTSLEYLEMNTLKRLESFKSIESLHLHYLKADGFVPVDKNCACLQNCNYILTNGAYDTESKSELIKKFTGDTLMIGGKVIKKGKFDPYDFIEKYKPENLLKSSS